MSIISNFSAVIFIFLTLAEIFKVYNVSAAAKDNATEDTDFTFLVTGGYRPEKHTLTKYLVSIRSRFPREFYGDNHFCGGSIIGPRIILTAAHCLTEGARGFPRHARSVRIVVKATNRLVKTDDMLLLDVRKIRVHPSYDPKTISNDIAIAKLDKDIDMDGRLAAIIPLPSGPAIPSLHCTVVGWGRILQNGPMAADAIYADVDIREDEKCKSYPMYKEGMLCASNILDPELDACTGDSGGPLICDLKLVGVVSYGMGCASGIPGVYTDVYFYRNWIKENHSHRHAALIFIIFKLAQIFKAFDAAAAAAAKDNATEDTDFTFLVTSGYRPETHTLTKYLVSIRLGRGIFFGQSHICGGSIIGPRIILTAAHCMVEGFKNTQRSARSIAIVAKTTNRLVRTDDTLEIGVEKVRVHPEFNMRTMSHDIAIAKVDQDIDIDGRLAAIISLANGPAIPGMQCTVVGWGRIFLDGPLPAEVLYADIHIREEEKCTHVYSPMYQKGMLCASNSDDPEVDSCQGDSGGPLICDLKLVGIVSYGLGCGMNIAGVYTDVGSYLKWIEENHSYRYVGSSFFILFCAITVIVFH